MTILRVLFFVVLIQQLFLSIGCIANDEDEYEYDYYDERLIYDPFESYNRKMYQINRTIYHKIVFPITDGYSIITTPAMRTGLSNFFNTILVEPSQLFYSLLQFDVRSALISSWRFAINNIVGIFGVIDVVTDYGYRVSEKSLLQTLSYYGYNSKNDFFFIIPAVGPSTGLQSINFALQVTLLSPSFFLQHISMTGNSDSIVSNRIYLDSNYTNVPGSDYIYMPLFATNLMTNLRPQLEAFDVSSFDSYNTIKTQYVSYLHNQIRRENDRTSRSMSMYDVDQAPIVDISREYDGFFN